MEKTTSSQNFKSKYYGELPSKLSWQDTPIQLYPLEQISSFLKLPTSLVKVDYNFILFIEDGLLLEQIETEQLVLSKNSFLFVKAGTIIAIHEILQSLKGYFLLIENMALGHILSENKVLALMNTQSFISLSEEDSQLFSKIYELLRVEIYKSSLDLSIVYSFVQLILHKYLQIAAAIYVENKAEQIALEFKRLVIRDVKEQKSPIYYATLLNISSNYLNRCLQSVFKKSAKELILETLVLKSQLKMANKTKTIAEICYELDIQDPSYFARLFKKITGISPSQYQRRAMHTLF